MKPKTWEKDTYARIGQAVKYWRSKRGMSARQLADHTGGRLTRGIIANLETGRRESVDITDLLVLSEALSVDVPALVFSGDEVEYTPGRVMTGDDALIEFTGVSEDSDRPLRAWHDWRGALTRADQYERRGNDDAADDARALASQAYGRWKAS